ncbi:hypothetical protein M8J75_003319 [Diaphorina citri]|nr:hypothetical protein M8J75_003319 [Diaphorina citri]
MVRGRGGQPTRGRGANMGTRGGRIAKNVGGRSNGNLDFGFSSQTKNSYASPNKGRNYNNYNSNNQGQQQQNNHGNNAPNNKRYGGGNAANNRFSGNSDNNKYGGGNTSNKNQFNNRGGNNYGQNKPQGQNQNYNNAPSNKPYNNRQNQGYNNGNQNNQGYKQNQDQGYNNSNQNNQGYNKPNYNNSGSNNSPFNQRPQNNSGYSGNSGYQNNSNDFNQQPGGNNFGMAKPSLLGTHPGSSNPPPPHNEPSSDDILKEIGKVFLTSMASGRNPNPGVVNPMMQNFQGAPPMNPSRYDNFYNNGNQYTNYNPPMFNNYRGGYGPRGGRGGVQNTRGGSRNSAVRGKINPQNRRTPGTPTGGVRKQPFKSKGNLQGSKNLKTMSFKSLKYSLLQMNKDIKENEQPLAAFLRQSFYDLSNEDKTHFLLLARLLLKNQNAVKLLSYEVKKCLDKKFGEGTEEEVIKKKLDLLKEKKTKFFNEYKVAFKDQGNLEEKEKAIDDALPILAGENFTEEHIPKPEEYVTDPNHTEEDFINNFKMTFVKSYYEKFLYRLNNGAAPTKSTEKRLKFHLDNGFLSHLLADKVKLKTNTVLPAVLTKYVKPIVHSVTKEKVERSIRTSVEHMTKNNEQVQTDISDFIGKEKVSAEVLRDFADCIIMFDKIATSIKFKLLNYTPYINLTADVKKSIFEELVNSVYTGAFNILVNKIKTSEKKFEDMVKDEVKEGEENKETSVDPLEDEEEEAEAE